MHPSAPIRRHSEPRVAEHWSRMMDAIAANAVADALEALAVAIRTSTALPGEPKAAPKSSTSKPKGRKPRRRSGKVATTRKSSAKPKAVQTPPVVEAIAVEPGDLILVPKAKGRAKPSAKQTVRRRYMVEWIAEDGTKFTHRTKFRFFAKAEAAADSLRNRGLDVTITPVNVAFKRKSKTTRQARTAAKAAAAKAA